MSIVWKVVYIAAVGRVKAKLLAKVRVQSDHSRGAADKIQAMGSTVGQGLGMAGEL